MSVDVTVPRLPLRNSRVLEATKLENRSAPRLQQPLDGLNNTTRVRFAPVERSG